MKVAVPVQVRPFVAGVLFGVLLGAPAQGLVIYRFGDADPAPPEAQTPGVEVVRTGWTTPTPSAFGQAVDLAITPDSIGSRVRDPRVNLAPAIPQLGGAYMRADVNGVVWDGDTSTVWGAVAYQCADVAAYNVSCIDDFGTPGTVNLVLGRPYQIDRVRIVSGLRDLGRVVQSLRVHVAPTAPSVIPQFHPPPFAPWLVEVRNNGRQVLDLDIPPHADAAFLQVTVGEHSGQPWEVHEIEVYARGVAKRATYVSNVESLGQPLTFGTLRWSGRGGTGARVRIQTRSGMDATPERYYRFTGRGKQKVEVSRQVYEELRPAEKAGTGYDYDNWSPWSQPFELADSAGVPVPSPSPRAFYQFRVDFLAEGDVGGVLRFLELHTATAVASRLVGEVWPVEAKAGSLTVFTYYLKPTLLGADGFDRVEIRSIGLLGPVLDVRHPLAGGEPFTWDRDGLDDPHRRVVALSRRLTTADSGIPLEIDFEARVQRYGTAFEARVWDSRRPQVVPQLVPPGDAFAEFEGDRVTVATAQPPPTYLRLSVDTEVLTPNGDGVNDAATLAYEVLEITDAGEVSVEVFDLSGRRVRNLRHESVGVGRYTVAWDGRDDARRLLPPGIYAARVGLRTESAASRALQLLHLAH